MTTEMTLAFGNTLAQTEWLSPAKLRLYQEPLIARLLKHAQTTADFYRERFDFDLDSPDAIEAAWSSIPILTRAEAVANRERLMSREVPAGVGPSSDGVTSTGYPFAFRRSQLVLTAAQALNERMYRWWKVDGAEPYARVAYDDRHGALPPDGDTLAGWHSAHPRAPHYFLSTVANVEQQLDWLIRRKPSYFASYANLLRENAHESMRSDRPIRFELLFSFGTVVDEETRDVCRSTFGAEIADTYGTNEMGHIAAQCRQCGEYHISAEAVRVEILRVDGSPARPGEIGRVVATSLYNYAMPLIRYEMGDLAEAGTARPHCRRGLPAIRRIFGRYRNVFRFRDGSVRLPSPERIRLGEMLPFRQLQVVQTDYDRIEIVWVPDGRDQTIDLAAITERFRAVLGQRVDVLLRQVENIERSPTGKFEDCISLVPPIQN